MKTSFLRLIGAALVGAATLLTASAVRAEDVAVCFGINEYSGLRPGSNLEGCVPDAKMFAETVRRLGFRPIVKTDGEATKQGVFNTIRGLNLRPSDRVIVYFASHGMRNASGASVLLPSDAQDNSEANDIAVDELYAAVNALPAASKFIVMDSCHSGGMVRGERGLKNWGPGLRPRFYVRTNKKRDIKAWNETEANDADVADNKIQTGPICYYAAALKTQVANEKSFGGESHGVFTYYLCKALSSGTNSWRDLCGTVAGGVNEATENEQQPLLYPTSFLTQVAFGGGSTPAPAPQPLGLDKVFSVSNPDPNMVSLKRYPDITPVAVNSANYVEITVGAEGYLLLLNRDPNGKLFVIWPKTPTKEAMKVSVGQKIRVPNGTRVMRPDTPGSDSLKAILFTSGNGGGTGSTGTQTGTEAGIEMMRSVQRGGATGFSVADAKREMKKARAWREDEDGGNNFFTSEVITRITP